MPSRVDALLGKLRLRDAANGELIPAVPGDLQLNSVPYVNASSQIQFDNTQLEYINPYLHINKNNDLTSGSGDFPFIKYGDANLDWQIGWNADFAHTYINGGNLRISGVLATPSINPGDVMTAYDYDGFGTGFIAGSTNFTYISSIVAVSRNGITTGTLPALRLQNTTAATAGVQVQHAPTLDFLGTAWNTTAVASRTARMIQEMRPVAGANPTASLLWRTSVDTGTPSYTTLMTLNTSGLAVTPAINTSASANEFGLQVVKNFTPTATSTGRTWVLNFSGGFSGNQNATDNSSGFVGVEGSISNTSTAVLTSASGLILFNSHGASATTTRLAGIDVYGADVSGNGTTGATVTEAATLIARMGRNTATGSLGNIPAQWGLQLRAATWSGVGHMTSQIGVGYSSGGTMNAITANGQTRVMFQAPAMPSPGAFTGTTIYAIDILGTSRTVRDGIRIAGDVELFSGAANRLDIAPGESFHIPNDINGFGVGVTPNTLYTANVRRTTTGALSTSPAVFNAEFVINHGVTGFPTALRMFVPINGGANTVGYAAGISAQVSVQNGHSGQANNITAADVSARWNTNQGTASSNSLLGLRAYVTSDNATISGTVPNLIGASLESGVNTATTTLTVTGVIAAAQFTVRVHQSGAGSAQAFGADFINHSIGTSAAINRAGHIRLAPLTASYGSGVRHPILFNGANTSENEVGIWWGTDANNIWLSRKGNLLLQTNATFRGLDFTTDGTNLWRFGGLTTVATTLDTTRHLNVTINGTDYKVALIV